MKILIALQSFCEYDKSPLEMLKKTGEKIILNKLGHRLNEDEILKLGRDCDGIVAGVEPYNRNVLAGLPKLRCISRCGVGIDNVDLAAARERNVAVCNTPNVVIQPVAEMTIAMIFDLLRLLTLHTTLLKAGRWEKHGGSLLAGSKVGIIGLGRIGRRVAEMLVALNADVYGADIDPDMKWAGKCGLKILPAKELMTIVDILCIHVSISGVNPFFLGKNEMALLKEGSVIINTSRGNIIDETALYDALKSKRLGGAGLDVFRKEPYDGPLRELDNVILTPHISTYTRQSRSDMEKESVMNLIAALGITAGTKK